MAEIQTTTPFENIYYKKPDETVDQYRLRTGLPKLSSTVISNDTAVTDLIPKANKDLSDLSQKGQPKNAYEREDMLRLTGGDATGWQYNPDGTWTPPADWTGQPKIGTDKTSAVSDLDAQEQDLYAQMRSSLDTQTKSQIDAIQQQYAVYKQQQEQLNKATEAGRFQSLLMGGALQGTVSGENILGAQRQASLSKIQQLDAEENSLIAKAKQSQQEGNFRIMQDQITQIREKRREKQAEASRLAEIHAKAVEDQNKTLNQARNANLIAKLDEQGLTPDQIIQYLNKKGYPVTADEVNKVVSLGKEEKADIASISDLVASELTGNPEKDQAIIDKYAKEFNVNPTKLHSAAIVAKRKNKIVPPPKEDKIRKLRRAAIIKARTALESNKGQDGFADPEIYLKLRSDYAEAMGDVKKFDDQFAPLLSPQERANLGVGKAVGIKSKTPELESSGGFWSWLGNVL